jgi:hypothetical protein
MRVIACLYIDTVRYDKIYHLSPIASEEEISANQLEKNLQAAFNAFELFPVVHLPAEGSSLQEITDNRVNTIIKDITNADNAKEQNVQTEKSD